MRSALCRSPGPSSDRRRRGRDSNPRTGRTRSTAFKAAAINQTLPPLRWRASKRLVLRDAEDDRDPPVTGPLLVAGEAGVERRRLLPEPLAQLTLCLPGAVTATATLGPELDLGIGDHVVVPGRVIAVASARGDQDDVVAVGEVGEWGAPLLVALRAGVREQNSGGVERSPDPAAAVPHQVGIDLVPDVDQEPGDRARPRGPGERAHPDALRLPRVVRGNSPHGGDPLSYEINSPRRADLSSSPSASGGCGRAK